VLAALALQCRDEALRLALVAAEAGAEPDELAQQAELQQQDHALECQLRKKRPDGLSGIGSPGTAEERAMELV